MHRRTIPCTVLLLLVLLPVLSPPSELARAAGPSARSGPDCALLDDPRALADMSGMVEWTLREQCDRLDEPDPALQGPVPAVPPPVGLDVRVNAIDPPGGGSIQSETSIAVNLDNGTLCAAYNDTYHWPSVGGTGYSRSTDGGQSWQDGGAFPAGGGGNSIADPSVVWRRADGYFYYTSILLVGPEYYVALWRSTDDCASFQWFGIVHTSPFDDKEFLAIDNTPTSPYYGRFYIVWTEVGTDHRIRLVYSDNATVWFGPVVLSSPTCQGPWPAIAPNGDVYVAWMNADPYPSGPVDVEVVRSVNGGASFSFVANPITNAAAPRDAQATANCGRPALKANANDGIRYYAMPQIAVGPDGCLHVVYSYDPDGQDQGDVIDVFYRRSCNYGASWEPEVRLNDDSGLTDQFFPAVVVNEDNVVAASWYDRRLDDPNNYLLNRYWTVSYDGGTTWEPNARVSDFSSPVYTSNCYHGDYDQMATNGDALYLLWSDDRIWFNGHYDPDVWFDQATVPHDFHLAIDPAEHEVCRPAVVTTTVLVSPEGIYNQPVLLSDSGVPAGVQTAFTPNPVDPLPGTSTYLITVTESAPEGSYPLVITGDTPTRTHSVTLTLTVHDCCEPVHDVDFAWTPVTPTAGDLVTFTASATGTAPITYSWKLGVGSWRSGQTVPYSYTLPGDYVVVLTATNCTTATATAVQTITVLPEHCEPVYDVDFVWSPVTPTVGEMVVFTGTATGTLPITYSWRLDVGSWKKGEIVTYSYALPGLYTVTLTATNCVSATATVLHTVQVLPEPVEHYYVYLPLVRRAP